MERNEKSSKRQRQDGQMTRERLLRCAGEIIAVKGYAATTSKEICTRAQANAAAINYYFGGREGLYRELLVRVHAYLLKLEDLQKLAASERPPREKLSLMLDMFIRQALLGESWQIAVWAWEILSPSPVLQEVIREAALPKGLVVTRMIGEYTGLPLDEPRLYSAAFSFLAPFLTFFLLRQRWQSGPDYASLLPVAYPLPVFFRHLKETAFAGLDACRQEEHADV